jgi:4-diphosphocytidyl-2-C-methyl-D-erythritol kinase
MPPITEIAYAKINLALHVRKRRDDGYHELESLVAFLGHGDLLTVEYAEKDSFSVDGEFAANSGNLSDNLVNRALNWARDFTDGRIPPLAITLTKHLPVAAGLGGGSADAAALLRLLHRQQMIPDLFERAAQTATLGADVPACLYSRPLIMRGIGEKIEWVDDSLDNLPVILINPRFPVSTGPVFKAWDQIDRGGLMQGTAREIATSGRNDLEAPAIHICPPIANVLAVLAKTQPLISRMSGSGASCFAIYDDPEKATCVEKKIKGQYPSWWVKTGSITR